MEEAWLERFLDLMPPNPRIVDIGCGAGEPVARHLIDKGCRLTGIDSSPAMIDICRGRFPGHKWVVADMRLLSLGRKFDGILAWNSFFHLTQSDQRAMFPAFGSLAASGSALMFTAGPQAGVAMGEMFGEPLFHASLDPDEYRSLLAANGFSVRQMIAEDPDCGKHTIWLAQAD